MSITKVETKLGKTIYAAIVVLFAIGFPLYLLRKTNVSHLEINIFSVLVSLLYIVVIIGFVLLIFKIEGVRLKALELDKQTQERLRLFYLFILILVILNLFFSAIWLYFEFFN